MTSKIIRWNIDIVENIDINASESILNTRSEEYESFLDSLEGMLLGKGYDFYEQHESNNENSQSEYLEYLKLSDDCKIIVVVFVRISDHPLPSRKDKQGNKISGDKLQRRYQVTRRIPELMEDFDNTDVPLSESIRLTFDNKHFTSYEDALIYVNQKINRLP